jgi:hypothetical protein
MQLNLKKCKEMVLSFLKYSLQYDVIHISGVPVERVSSFKLLGLLLSDDLSSLSNKLNSSGMTHFNDKEIAGRESEPILPDISRKCFDINYKPIGKGLVMASLNINSLLTR